MSDRPLLLKDVVNTLTELVWHQRSIRELTLFDAGVRAELTFVRIHYGALPDSITRRLTEVDAEAMKEESSKVYALAGTELREHVERVASDAAFAQTIRAANHYRRLRGMAPREEEAVDMSKSEQTGRVCPKCGRRYTEPPALSREDNATDICPDCGMMEALASIPRRREGPAERTRRAVYATGNRWAIENFNATHG